jgi:hypothetical protein
MWIVFTGGERVKKSTRLLVWGIGLGTALLWGWRRYQGRRGLRDFHLTTADLNYSDRSSDELASEHLIDLNTADSDQLGELGISEESLERLLENRPYRNKLELVSRMILTQDDYTRIKDRIGTSAAREHIKTFG